MTSRIPPLLDPYLVLPPEASLILLTSVLGASTNWLVLRYLYSALLPAAGVGRELDRDGGIESGDASGKAEGDRPAVVLVSFLRDLSFWREGARKLVRSSNPHRPFWSQET
jgi:elongator complex protein 6